MGRTRCLVVGAVAALALPLVAAAPAGAADVVLRANTADITIPDSEEPSQPASPYPTTIEVAGASGPITNLEVVIPSLAHEYPDDLEILLVGPTGLAIVLMADVGGSRANGFAGVELRFKHGSPGLPDFQPITSGTFAPTLGTNGDDSPGTTAFPAPAPAPSTTELASFNGTSPVGTWQLFVHDDSGGAEGALTGGWRIEFTVDSAACLDGPEDGFTDVNEANVHEAAIDCLVSFGIATGTSPTTFNPGGNVTRAQMASFVARAVEATATTLPASPPDAFTDDEGDTHELRIDQLTAAGVIGGNGESGSSYFPGADMRRDHMASYMFEAFELVVGTPLAAGPDAFTDDDGNPHEAAINALAAEGVISGTGGGLFAPSASVSRAQMGSFLARFLQLLDEKGALPG